MTKYILGEHDAVALRKDISGFPAGTRGVIVANYPPDAATVELVLDPDDPSARALIEVLKKDLSPVRSVSAGCPPVSARSQSRSKLPNS